MRIDEFEFRNKQGEEIEPTKDQLVVYIKSLHKEIKTLNKALEMACDTVQFEDTCDYCAYKGELEITNDCPRWCETDEKFFVTQTMGYFKEQAKEAMKSEL